MKKLGRAAWLAFALTTCGTVAHAQSTYTWNAAGTAAWTTSTNWTPTRTTPAADDILVFNAGGAVTVTSVPTQTIGRLTLSGSSTVNLQSGAASNVLTIAGGTGVDLDVPASSELDINGANALAITVGAGATGSASGTLATVGTLTNSGTMNVSGTFRIDQGGFANGTDFVYGASGTLAFNNSAGSYGVNAGHVYWPAASGPPNVTVQGAGGITMNVARTVSGTFKTAAGVANGGNLTLSGVCQIDAGGFFTGSPTYSGTATLVYNTPGGFNVADEWTAGTSVGSGVPRNVTLTAGAGTVTLPTSDRTIPGNLTITTGTLALNAMSGDLMIGGNWSRTGGSFTANNRAVFFNGTGTQTIADALQPHFAYLVVDKASGNLTLAGAIEVFVDGAAGDVLQIVGAGGIDLGTGTLHLPNAGGNIKVNGGARTITGSAGIAGGLDVGGAKTVTATAGGTLVIDTNTALKLGAGLDCGVGLTTVNGILAIQAGGFVNGNPPSYGPSSKLVYQTAGSYGRGAEWSATSGAGYPTNVQVTANTLLDLGANGGAATARQLAGNLTIDVGSTLSLDATPMSAALTVLGNASVAGTLTLSSLVDGDLVLNGNLTVTGTFNSNGRAVFFRGTGIQQVQRTGGITIDYLRLEKASGSVQLASAMTSAAPAGGNSLEFNGSAGDVLDLNGQTLTLAGTVGGTNAAGALKGSSTSNLVLNGTGAMGTIKFAAAAQLLNNLTLNRTATGTVTLGTPLAVGGTLTFTNGKLLTGANTLTISPGGTASGASQATGYVVGNLKKTVQVLGGVGSQTFEVGDAARYASIDISGNAFTASFDVTATTTSGDHASIAGSGLVPSRTANRVWTLSSASTDPFNATFHFTNPADLDAGADPTTFRVRRFAGAAWSATTPGANTSTTTQATSIAGYGDFVVGNLPTLTIDDVSVTEGNSGTTNATFTVSLSSAAVTGFPVSVDVATADGTATTANNDYQPQGPTTLTFSTGQTTKSVLVPVLGDTKFEANENFFVNLTSVNANATVADAQGAGTIQNDDTTPSATISDVSASEGNAGTTAFTFTVSLSNQSAQPVTIQYQTHDVTATLANSDYVVAAGTVTIPAKTLNATVSVTVNGDTKREGDETFTIDLTNPVNATLADAQGVGTIQNDDSVPSLSISDVTAAEGNSGLTTFTFTVSLSNTTDQPVSVQFQTADGTAMVGAFDYLGNSGLLSIPAKTLSTTANVSVKGDLTNEPDETFFVNLQNPTNATIADGQGVGTIQNDDDTQAPSVTVVAPNGHELKVTGTHTDLLWSASDNVGVTAVDLYLSRAGTGGPFEVIALGEANDGTYNWVVTGPPTGHAILRVVAHDAADNSATDESDEEWAIDVATGVDSTQITQVTAFAITRIAPNPATRLARIDYAVAREARVRLSVLDLQGRTVSVLVDGVRSPGRHQIVWNVGARGDRVKPGVYFVRYVVPGSTMCRRIVVGS